jgi:phosphatidylglycerophosphate synthase
MARDRASSAVRRYVGDLALGIVPLGAVAAATWRLIELPATYVAVVAALYAGTAALLLGGAARGFGAGDHDIAPGPPRGAKGAAGAGMGAANRVTLFRAIIALPIAALVGYPDLLVGLGGPGVSIAGGATGAGPASLGTGASPAAWWVIGISTVAMVLDAVDGRIARSTGTGSVLGARFDMELDAFFLLALSLLVWQSGRAGPWVLGIGALRYLFVAAGWLTERLRGDLPESFRRKTACVVAGIALLVSLGPIIPARLAALAAAVGLVSLVYSFAVDVAWLLGRPANHEPAEGH